VAVSFIGGGTGAPLGKVVAQKQVINDFSSFKHIFKFSTLIDNSFNVLYSILYKNKVCY
jgi:hypothetical protein